MAPLKAKRAGVTDAKGFELIFARRDWPA